MKSNMENLLSQFHLRLSTALALVFRLQLQIRPLTINRC